MRFLTSLIAGLFLVSVTGAAPLCPPAPTCAPQATCCCASADAPDAGCCTVSAETPAPQAALAPAAADAAALAPAPRAAASTAPEIRSALLPFSHVVLSPVAPLPGADAARAPPTA